jgi:hypothetical protein
MSWSIPLDQAVQNIANALAELARISEENGGWALTRNSVGNWSVLDEEGHYVGYVSLPQGEVDLVPEDEREAWR